MQLTRLISQRKDKVSIFWRGGEVLVVPFHKCDSFFSRNLISQLHIRNKICWAAFIIWGLKICHFHILVPCVDNQRSECIGRTEQNPELIAKYGVLGNKIVTLLLVWARILQSLFFCLLYVCCILSCINNVSTLSTDILYQHYFNGGQNVFFLLFLVSAGMPWTSKVD